MCPKLLDAFRIRIQDHKLGLGAHSTQGLRFSLSSQDGDLRLHLNILLAHIFRGYPFDGSLETDAVKR